MTNSNKICFEKNMQITFVPENVNEIWSVVLMCLLVEIVTYACAYAPDLDHDHSHVCTNLVI